MKWPSMTRYFVMLLIAFLISAYMIYDFQNKYHISFDFDTEKSDF